MKMNLIYVKKINHLNNDIGLADTPHAATTM